MHYARIGIRIVALLVALSCSPAGIAATHQDVLTTYADIAHAVYEDSLLSAERLQQRIDAFLDAPSAETMAAARDAWIAARVPYQQSEAFRFGNAIVDNWQGQVNSWPLDEGLIDYVDSHYQSQLGNPGGQLNIIANTSTQIGRKSLDMTELTPELLAGLNELAGSEANVATGYHAIEFLLWGQDTHGSSAGAGERPYTDYVPGDACTHGHCARRAEYLRVVTGLLLDDLQYMVGQWARGSGDNYRAQLLALAGNKGLARMIFGMGSLAMGELAGERMKVALEANSPEDEHDCFSDNTHYSHYFNGLGIRNLYLGQYRRIDGSIVTGASLSELVADANHGLDAEMRAALERTQSALETMVDAAERDGDPMHFDQMIAAGNDRGRQIVENAIDALVVETDTLVRAATRIGIDSLSPDNANHQF